MTLGACRPAVFHSAQRSIAATPVRRDLDMGKPHPDQMASLKGEIPQHIHDLCDKICALNMIEAAELGELIKIKLKIPDDAVMGMPMMGAPMMGGAAPAGAAGGAAGGAAADAEAEKKEQTEFELKLDSFDAATKLKVIKEVRTVSGLGLKESKDLVEGAPASIKTGLSKEDAEKFKKLIEDAGGKVSIV